MQEVFGEPGRHARSAVGVPVLPLGVAVEVDAIVAIKPERLLIRSIPARPASRIAGCTMARSFPKTACRFRRRARIVAGIECDLRLTADDQIVVFHDADFAGDCAPAQLRTSASRRSRSSGSRLGDGPIPTLESVLVLVAGRVPLLIEGKVDGDMALGCRSCARRSLAIRGPSA